MHNPEKRRSTDQREAKVWRFIADNASNLAKQGSVARTWRGEAGPYFRLDFCDGTGRTRSVYLGANVDFASRVRQKLSELQAPSKLRRQLSRARQSARAELRRSVQNLERQIAALGLHLKGYEIRGLRSAVGFND